MEVAVILSGCGVLDGSEIHESVCLALSLEQAGHRVSYFAPDMAQAVVTNGMTGQVLDETRNVLVESARIARGKIRPLSEMGKFDAVALPGGLGAARNLCDFAVRGAKCEVNGEVTRALKSAHEAGAALGFMCIAPVIAARLFEGVRVTLGGDGAEARACEAMGAHHVVCRADEACIDKTWRVASVPAYMAARSISECFKSARALVSALETLCDH